MDDRGTFAPAGSFLAARWDGAVNGPGAGQSSYDHACAAVSGTLGAPDRCLASIGNPAVGDINRLARASSLVIWLYFLESSRSAGCYQHASNRDAFRVHIPDRR